MSSSGFHGSSSLIGRGLHAEISLSVMNAFPSRGLRFSDLICPINYKSQIKRFNGIGAQM